MQKMKVSQLKINKYYNQPISNRSREKLKDDIKNNGITEPLIIDVDGKTIVDGMIRLQIAKELGIEEVPVEFIKAK